MDCPVLTLDCSPAFSGWAIVFDGVPLGAGRIKSNEMSPSEFSLEILKVVELALEYGCQWCLAERPFKGKSIGTFGESMHVLGLWRGVWLVTGATQGVTVLYDEVASSTWRKIFGPEGPKLKRAAAKAAAKALVKERFNMSARGKGALKAPIDTAEAICFGLWADKHYVPVGS